MADALDLLIARGPPTVDFSPIGNLVNDYTKGVQSGAQVGLLKALQNGVPTDANGNPDYTALANLAAKGGDLKSAAGFASLGQSQKTRAAIPGILSNVFGGGSGAAAPAAAPSNPLTGDYFSKVAQTESGGDPNAVNPTTGASGSNQFLQSTWLDLMKRHPELGLTAQGIFDPTQQKKAMQAFTSDNFDYLSANGVNPSDQNLYLAHFAGPEGAVRFLQGAQSNPNAPAASLFGPAAVKANYSLFFGKDGRPVSAGDFYQNLTGRFATGAQQGSVAQPAQPAQGGQGGLSGMDPMRLFQAGLMLSSIPGGEETGKALVGFAQTLQAQQQKMNTPVSVAPGASLVTPNGRVVMQNGSAIIDDTTINAMADQALAGDTSVFQNLGRGAQGAENIARLRKAMYQRGSDRGMDSQDIASKVAEFQGTKSAERVLGQQESKMGTAAFEAKGAINLARQAINQVPRTGFLPFNQLIQLYQKNALDPNQAELVTRVQGVINTYAAVMARGANVTTDSARSHAEALLNTAGNPEVFNRVLDTMQSEIDMAINSPDQMRKFFRARDKGGNAAPASPASPNAPATTVAKVTSNAEANQEIARARAAVAQGADRNAVLQMLQQKGVPTAGLTF